MNLCFHPQAWEDYRHWQQNDKQALRKLNQLLRAIQRDPFEGIGKPEALRQNLAGFWSRRITDEHRVVYKVLENDVLIAQCRSHDGD